MLTVDLHVHSLFSACGLHTFLELLEQGHKIGLQGMAITDHGLTLGGGRLTSVFFERFQSPYPDMKLYKGIELNLLEEKGTVDMPRQFMPFLDIILCGIHPNLKPHLSKDHYTDMLLATIKANPFIDIITHPNDPHYPLDYDVVASAARGAGMALELNNSKILYNRSTVPDTLELIYACKKAGCPIVVNSDTHAIHELGLNESVQPLLEEADFPQELVVNRNSESTESFLSERRLVKQKSVG